MNFSAKQLQKKFKHAKHLGVTGNYNAVNAVKFQSAMAAHIANPATKTVPGTYRGQPVTHFVNPQTGLNVIQDVSGQFLSGWKLTVEQLKHVLLTGKLGGN